MYDYNENDQTLIEVLAADLWRNRGKVVGEGHLCRRVAQLPWEGPEAKKRSRTKLYFLMPGVDVLLGTRHPGWFVYRPGDGTARTVSERELAVRTSIPRARQIVTKVQRVWNDLQAVRFDAASEVDEVAFADWSDRMYGVAKELETILGPGDSGEETG